MISNGIAWRPARSRIYFVLCFFNDLSNYLHMKKSFVIVLLITASFISGFAVNSIITQQHHKATNMKRVTGIGGVFFKCKDPKKVTEWYQKHLGLNTNPY